MRQPPQVIHLTHPPPEKKWILLPIRRKLILWLVVCAASFVGGLVFYLLGDFQLSTARGDKLPAGLVLPIATIGAGIFYFGTHVAHFWGYLRIVKKHKKRGNSQPPPHPLAEALWPYWQFGLNPPRPADVFRIAEGSTSVDRNRALIVCLRDVKLPEPTDHFFEPVVVAPTWGMRQLAPFIVGITLLVAFLDWLFSLRMPRRGLFFMFGGAGVYIAIWSWLRVLRPRYYRFAPGIVQVIRFGGGLRSKPVIRSYNMEAGTVTVFRRLSKGNKWQTGMEFDVFTGDQSDRVSVRPGDIDGQTGEEILAALMSTARIPELSESDLVG